MGGAPAASASPVVASAPVGLIAAPAFATPGYRLRTGVPGPVAFAASLVAFQAWASVIYGIVVGVLGGLVNNVNNGLYDNGNNCSAVSYCSDSYNSGRSASHGLVFLGVVLLLLGLVLVASVVDLLKGNNSGRVMTVIAETIFLVIGIWAGVKSKNAVVGVLMCSVPLVVILAVGSTGARRLIADAKQPLVGTSP